MAGKKKAPPRRQVSASSSRGRELDEHFHSSDPRQTSMLEELAKAVDVSIIAQPEGWMVERRVVARTLVQLQYVRCGKKCWCMRRQDPPFHGPYWYAYTYNRRGKLRCSYVGLELDAERVRDAIE